MKFRSTLLAATVMVLTASVVRAEVTLPSIFSDNAVLQCDEKVVIWGWADPNESIAIELRGRNVGMGTAFSADKNGRFKAYLGPLKAGGPYKLVVKGRKNSIEANNILIGEVWLCSGQSNMAMTVRRCKGFEKEKKEAKLPQIRMFRVAQNPAAKPQDKVKGTWVICSPETVGGFSGTGYFFGRMIHRELKVPVGLINSSSGGTAIEAWTSMAAQKKDPKLTPIFEKWQQAAKEYDPNVAKARYDKQLARWKELAKKAKLAKKRPPRRPRQPVDPRLDRNHPSNLFNGMIAPLVPYTIRGVLWYQGERNTRSLELATLYRHQLPLLVRDWREQWGTELPFFWVQLPNFRQRVKNPVQETSTWAMIRESMLDALKVPNTGMAITIDIGEADDIHPKNKQDTGKRLAHLALAKVYEKDVVASGPLLKNIKTKGDNAILTFDHTGGGLVAKGGKLEGFAIAGKDGKWHPAEAKIEKDTVVVRSAKVKRPVAVRYAWADNPEATLFNKAGIPASPFRTDR